MPSFRLLTTTSSPTLTIFPSLPRSKKLYRPNTGLHLQPSSTLRSELNFFNRFPASPSPGLPVS